MESRPPGSLLKTIPLWMSRGPDSDAQDQPAEFSGVLERAVAGDSAAFEELVVRYERRILTLAWRLLGTLDDAKDAAQEVFLRAFKYLHRYDARKPFEGWLVGIAVNVCRDLDRDHHRRTAFISELDSPKPFRDPHSALALDERKRLLNRALQGLSQKERAALILRDLEGFSTAETAALLGLSEAAVRALIGRGLVKLRLALARMKGDRP